MREATVIASSWSWVTITKVVPVFSWHGSISSELGVLAQLLVPARPTVRPARSSLGALWKAAGPSADALALPQPGESWFAACAWRTWFRRVRPQHPRPPRVVFRSFLGIFARLRPKAMFSQTVRWGNSAVKLWNINVDGALGLGGTGGRCPWPDSRNLALAGRPRKAREHPRSSLSCRSPRAKRQKNSRSLDVEAENRRCGEIAEPLWSRCETGSAVSASGSSRERRRAGGEGFGAPSVRSWSLSGKRGRKPRARKGPRGREGRASGPDLILVQSAWDLRCTCGGQGRRC